MTTELERLKAWMAENGHTVDSLLRALRTTKGHSSPCFSGTKPFYIFFKWRFAGKFGAETAIAIFDLKDYERAHIGDRDWSEAAFHPDRAAASLAVLKAVQQGGLLRAKTHKCHGCDKQATEYHHESYAPEDRLCVVPLCRSCHQRHHTGRQRLTFGVVPTAVGIIRIAIAST